MNQTNPTRSGSRTMAIVLITFLITLLFAIAGWYFLLADRYLALISPVQETAVMQGDLEVEISAPGELLPVNSYPVSVPETLFSDFNIDQIAVIALLPDGKLVDKGEHIASLDPSVYTSVRSRLENELADLENKLNEIAADSVRQLKDVKLAFQNSGLDLEIRKIAVEQSLFDPVSAHERMKLEYRKSELAYENALFNLQDKRKSLLEKYVGYPAQIERLTAELKTHLPMLKHGLEIQTPYRGLLLYVNEGEISDTKTGRVLTPSDRIVAEVADISRLVSVFLIDETYFPELTEGQIVKIFLKSNGEEVEARISRIGRTIESHQGKKYFRIESVMENPGNRFIPYQTTSNRVILRTLEDVLYVPNSAVGGIDSDTYAIVAGGIRKPVVCKPVNDRYTVIVSGLTAGEMIYLNAENGYTK
jgi:multidrug efflux pump subunit AcrA (membrane-fusion protein)